MSEEKVYTEENGGHSDKIPVKEIGQLLDSVANKVPTLVAGLMKSMYTAEAGKNMGQAVGELYKELISAGLPQDVAVSMAREYMLSVRALAANIPTGGNAEEEKKKGHDWEWKSGE